MKKKTTTNRKKVMIRKMKKEALKKERRLIRSENIDLIPTPNENIEVSTFDFEILKTYLNELTHKTEAFLNQERETLKNKIKNLKSIFDSIRKTISYLRKVQAIDDKKEKILYFLYSYLIKIENFINREKKSISVVLSLVFAMNSASAKEIENPYKHFNETKKSAIEDTVLPSILDNAETEIEFLDILAAIENEYETQAIESDESYSEDVISIYEKEQAVMAKENLSFEQLYTLLDLMLIGNCPFANAFNSHAEALDYLYESECWTYADMMLIIMARDGYSYNELDAVCAGCVAEARGGGTCYIDAYAVASIFLNRTNYIPYINAYTTNYYTQFVAPNQFQVYDEDTYLEYLGRIDLPGYQAAIDAFYSKLSMHDYLEFRGSWVDVKHYEQFVSRGNKYLARMKEQNIASTQEESTEEVMTLVLKNSNTDYVDY